MDGGAQDFLTERFTNCTLQNLSSPPVRSTLNKQPEAPYKPLFSDILRHSHPATMFWSLEIGLAMYTCPLISHSTHSRASSLFAIRLSQTNSRGIVMRSIFLRLTSYHRARDGVCPG